jgi:hypothetical protein
VSDDEFIACVRDSSPYAWSVVTDLAERLRGQPAEPPDEAARGQLSRLVGGDAMRAAVGLFTVRLAFQNCHRLA